MSTESKSRWRWFHAFATAASLFISILALGRTYAENQRSEAASIQAAGDMLGQARDIVLDERKQIAVMQRTLGSSGVLGQGGAQGHKLDPGISEIRELLQTASDRCSYSERLIDETQRLEEQELSSASLKILQHATEALEAGRRCHAKVRRAESLMPDLTNETGTTQ